MSMEIKIGGVYKHYKGRLYKVHNIAMHSEELKPYVYYECLYENELGKFWLRPLDNFLEEITIDDGNLTQRFKHVEE